MAKVLLFANERCALNVIKKLKSEGDEIVHLYLSKKGRGNEQILAEANLPADKVFFASSMSDPEHLKILSKLEFDYILSVQWLYLLKPEIFNLAKKGSINFHPALLPWGRGWYAHVHNIIQGTQAGVTLHQIDGGADSGPIWGQKKISIFPEDQAKDVYLRLQDAMIQLFDELWPRIKSGECKPVPQDSNKVVYFEKAQTEAYDKIDLDKTYTGREMINILRARSFGDRGFAYFMENGKKIFVNIKMNKEN